MEKIAKYLKEDNESVEGIKTLLGSIITNWAALQKELLVETTETINDQVINFINKVDEKVNMEEAEGIDDQVYVSLQKLSDRINKQYDVILNPYFKKKGITDEMDKPLEIRDFTNLLILIDSLLMHYDIEVYDEDKDLNVKVFVEGKIAQKQFGIKNFLAKTVGKFLVIANNNNIKSYDDQALNNKLVNYKKQIFAKAMFLIFNVSWLPKERTYKNTLVLNMLHSMELGNEAEDYGDIMAVILSYTQKIKNLNPDVVRECTNFYEYYLPKYLDWKKLEIKERTFLPLSQIEEYNILFAKKLGFYTVDIVQSNGNSDIIRAGYPLVKDHFVWENVPMGDKSKKVVIYQ
ncbi:hypothetical protein KMW28_24595 [Flammeovirga yaeyamensis]|uniref:Uncharacterized protein n=1 Tax=Flammeovirga yaeyamensis TaxID=367791 RepID=A0AAX1NE70_9BACT|nr:hypothetical protein [Flammeovirga yaeyamensis]MBB3699533.1 hypothetical protein [Flammeovirga yaeyamensis]NMF35211.1 hypothetical protein [Flammeovirga yaeyamensis]QWG04073.1 hypothetical protein KMW28_24595 [Flammeovirga yaeyamensis]